MQRPDHPLSSFTDCTSFFFQAEAGIRDLYVAGVQTCALPILGGVDGRCDARGTVLVLLEAGSSVRGEGDRRRHLRSEERRVGKECRFRWSKHLQKKKSKEFIGHCKCRRMHI